MTSPPPHSKHDEAFLTDDASAPRTAVPVPAPAPDSPQVSNLKSKVETAGRIYFSFCRRVARTVNRLRGD